MRSSRVLNYFSFPHKFYFELTVVDKAFLPLINDENEFGRFSPKTIINFKNLQHVVCIFVQEFRAYIFFIFCVCVTKTVLNAKCIQAKLQLRFHFSYNKDLKISVHFNICIRNCTFCPLCTIIKTKCWIWWDSPNEYSSSM